MLVSKDTISQQVASSGGTNDAFYDTTLTKKKRNVTKMPKKKISKRDKTICVSD